ncbi:MAG: 50S ribosomal protein L21 [Nitrospirae bacterium]|jgi:large subunit ribosomal protein L21|nr:50S ribosomal protein L21 [Nitrospirota bacterium]
MYAIIETGGKQYRVSPGKTLKVEKLPFKRGEDVTFDKVLMVNKEGKSIYGSPYVSEAKVIASVDNEGKAKKVLVFKQKPRKGYRKLRGHRQHYTALKIKEIISGG